MEAIAMNIGYACLTEGVLNTRLKTCNLKNATPERLKSVIQSNLDSLENMIEYNIKNRIKLLRISSDIVPFGSHPINTLPWWDIFANRLKEIGDKAKSNGIRLTMHPGQYTVLNSPSLDVVERAVKELQYHARFLDAMNLNSESKMILHIGGVYGDKKSAIQRFIKQYRLLDENIKNRLVIENDDKQYNISDVLSIGESEGIPVVFDNLHNELNSSDLHSEFEWISLCKKTWKPKDGHQKIHYSQQAANKRNGSHSETIDVEKFLNFYKNIPDSNTDIMLEVKDKNLSAVKCVNAISSPKIGRLEKEWGRYKYLILEHSPRIYNEIRQLLKPKDAYPVVDFYKLIDEAMRTPISGGKAVNVAQHIWGYVSNLADEKESNRFEKNLGKVNIGGSTTAVKRTLWKLSVERKQQYLLDSLYFMKLY